ncbi:uncharacterized protein ACLA_059300 [Aspergillus clavatus NRRL 1]|uniref:Uncharacterized protein n=1 Tax=Aspergillus clavatus (strain ATCC 1007 / CBS 513.65 / DSM 816 / NCTC 3887 / NRRL 1 / QM 1276 / 107) TaxID=344612 RepID=A1C4C6_ASPCL|nr:uncharacterized protein ACLA_059300 [Aspergillus clavatus NRRL 1]EAW15266.1 conserved hypothetical protein [Aspergillus clavatus NRRL 1]
MPPKDSLPQPGDEAPDMPSVAPDVLCLDGHLFRINYDVPEEITRQLEELYNRDAKYEEIPEHLKAYETEMEDSDVEEAKELERLSEEQTQDQTSKNSFTYLNNAALYNAGSKNIKESAVLVQLESADSLG